MLWAVHGWKRWRAARTCNLNWYVLLCDHVYLEDLSQTEQLLSRHHMGRSLQEPAHAPHDTAGWQLSGPFAGQRAP